MMLCIRQLMLVLCLAATLPHLTQARTAHLTTVVMDEEYDTYRKKGDDYFKAGRYADARRQYQNCLEVPGFESDEYAKWRIELTTQCLVWLQQVDEAVQSQNDSLVISSLQQVLAVNPTDGQVLIRLAEHYELKGNEQNALDRFADAKTQYLLALNYARAATNRVKIGSLEAQIKALDARLDQHEAEQERRFRTVGPAARPAKPDKVRQRRVSLKLTPLKVGLGALAVGAGYYAYLIDRDYQEKAAVVKRLNEQLDPNNTGQINDNTDYKPAYEAAQAAYNRRWLYNTCLGVAAAAVLTDAYLFVRRPKSRPIGLFWQPATRQYGLTVGYRF